MKTYQKLFGLSVPLFALAVVPAVSFGAEEASANFAKGFGKGPQVSEEVREELRATLESGDYDDYVEVAEANELRVMDEDRFEQKVEHYEKKQEIKAAILDGDYDEWRSLVGEERMENVTVSNFYLLTDLAEAREADDEDAEGAAKQVLEDAGIEREGKKGKRGGDRGDRGERLDRQNISELSDDEKQTMLEEMIERLKARLGIA